MKIIETDLADPKSLSAWERDQVYNGMDCCVTAEVLEVLKPQLDEHTSHTYNFSRALQGPVLEMNLRGVKVDMRHRTDAIDFFYDLIDKLECQLDEIVLNSTGMHKFSWRSNDNLKTLFYDKFKIPPIIRQGRPTVNRDALEKLEQYFIARQVVAHLIAMRDLGKKISFLKTEVDHDKRIRTSYNISGTSTGRFSSSYSEYGTGTNLQNVEEELRRVFIADSGMKFAKFDAKSGESYAVGAIEWNLFKDPRFLDACESGDPHTWVAKLCWPELTWAGNLKKDKEIAEQAFYRHYTYRFMCKKIGHGSNYGGQPATLSQQAKLPINIVAQFQPKYFKAFPAHLQWHGWVENQLLRAGHLITLTGRKRWFFGRRNDPKTLRDAIAYDPQGSLADIVNDAMLRIWRQRTATIMMQDHDALTFQYPEEQEDEIIPKLQKLLPSQISLKHGRILEIPYDCQVGWNKGKWDGKKNPDGLKDYQPGDKRRRTEEVSILDRVIR